MSETAKIAGWYPDPTNGATRWWDGTKWTKFQSTPHPTNHILHLILSVITFGLWIPVWIIVSIVNSRGNQYITK